MARVFYLHECRRNWRVHPEHLLDHGLQVVQLVQMVLDRRRGRRRRRPPGRSSSWSPSPCSWCPCRREHVLLASVAQETDQLLARTIYLTKSVYMYERTIERVKKKIHTRTPHANCVYKKKKKKTSSSAAPMLVDAIVPVGKHLNQLVPWLCEKLSTKGVHDFVGPVR